MRKSFFASALTAGLIAGALDITAAAIFSYTKFDRDPITMLKGIAKGAFGDAATSGGTMMAVWGLIFHFIIAISFTFFFFFLVKLVPSLLKYPIPIGILYGVFVWGTMRFIILPYLSRITPKPIVTEDDFINAAINAGILVICIGIPVALLARKYVRGRQAS
jgi:uncharacterized membrane protein YagU involved in acid resistance